VKKISVKQHNRKSILSVFRTSKVLSVSEAVRKTGVSKPTVQKIINYFEERNIISYEGKGGSSEEGGKRPNLYRFNPAFGSIISIHVGPDFVYGAITDMNAEILHSYYSFLEKVTVESIVSSVVSLIDAFFRNQLIEKSPPQSIVLGLPGIVDVKKGLLIYSPHISEPHADSPIVEMILQHVHVTIPIYTEGINRLQAFAEMKKGQAEGIKNFMTVDAMKEGLGSGVVVNGMLRHGLQSLSGEVGHMVLDPNGPTCICGGKGCFEAIVSMKQIHRLIREGETKHPDSQIVVNYSPNMVSLETVFSAYEHGDQFAAEIVEQMAAWFARGINNLIMVNDPQLVILQGIYNAGGERFVELIRKKLAVSSLPYIRKNIQIKLSQFGEERGIIGGACFGVFRFFEHIPLN